MCNPTMASSVTGAAEAYGEYAAAQNERTLHRLNEHMAEFQARDAIQRGREEMSRVRQRKNQVIGSQRATYGAQNVDIGTGSAADVQADTAYLAEQDVDMIRINAAREAWGYQTDAAYSRFQGQQAGRAAPNRALQSILGNLQKGGAFAKADKTVEGVQG